MKCFISFLLQHSVRQIRKLEHFTILYYEQLLELQKINLFQTYEVKIRVPFQRSYDVGILVILRSSLRRIKGTSENASNTRWNKRIPFQELKIYICIQTVNDIYFKKPYLRNWNIFDGNFLYNLFVYLTIPLTIFLKFTQYELTVSSYLVSLCLFILIFAMKNIF